MSGRAGPVRTDRCPTLRCFVAGLIGSRLSDKFGCRAVAITGGLLLCIGHVLCSFATRLFHVYLALSIVAGMNLFMPHSHCSSYIYTHNVVKQR